MRHVGRAGPGYEALPKFPRAAGQPWANIYAGPEHVIFGHHARRRLQVWAAWSPCQCTHVVCLARMEVAEAVLCATSYAKAKVEEK